MHTGPMPEDAGKFNGGWIKSDRPCTYCGVSGSRYYMVWESSDGGYEDEKNKCEACGKTWWVDGIDS